MSTTHKIACAEPWFSLICQGLKRIDGRCGEKYEPVKTGDILQLECKSKTAWFRVVRVAKYASFVDMLGSEPMDALLPGIQSKEEALKVYKKFYSPEFECKGVYAFEMIPMELLNA
jgi:ASC-1-like (ASCH) protein